ncbi:hypothetical protein A6X20_35535 [Bradyrhizobium elkanii]|nr:hypothetical protein A6452_03135 [Bradyrhizobium elkanii]ODM73873.1 hypothetical protein A6X20_35535 [Bradyrhizobium elkanii]
MAASFIQPNDIPALEAACPLTPRKRETTEVRPIQLNLISIWAHGTKAGTGDDGPRHEFRRRNIRLLSFF